MADSDDNPSRLAPHRAAIDALDREILERLNARAAHAQAIGTLKGAGVAYRPEREAQVLARLQSENKGPLSNEAVAGVFRQVMSACLALERTLRIAYLGPAGTFSHDAVARHFGQFVDMLPCVSIDDVFRSAESGRTDYAVVPVENSSEGAVGRTLDLMCQTPLTICGEIRLRIRQNLLSTAASADGIA
jgi:chorismate mutase/prephenate dehydratase